MKPTAQRKAKRAAGKKRATDHATRKAKALKKKTRHEQSKKEKAAKAKKRRASFERALADNKRKPEEKRKSVLGAGDGILPRSRKYKKGKAQIALEAELQRKSNVQQIADKGATIGNSQPN